MKTELSTPYLIQRAKFKDNPNRIGIDAILEFDYMGSAEFEWGALPKSLNRIRETGGEYEIAELMLSNGKIIQAFSLASNAGEIIEFILGLANNKYQLKEFSDFDTWISDNPRWPNRFDFWWDIENDYMFWKKDEEFLKKFVNAIKEINL